jgi:putative ABC transport system substrate-binding protein
MIHSKPGFEHLNRPGGNMTGVTAFAAVRVGKRLELLHHVLPKAVTVAFLRNPNGPVYSIEMGELMLAAQALGCRIETVEASTESELELAFANI